jgi:Protein of unknown function (DUF2497)
MTTINGANHHNVEDILSSIRNSMGEEHAFARVSAVRPLARRESGPVEEGAEFELPAIFKPGHSVAPEKTGNIFGRLGEAIKPSSGSDNERSRTVIRFEPASARMIEPPVSIASARPAQPKPASEPAHAVLEQSSTLKREMPSFFDTRLNKLGEMTRQASVPRPTDARPADPNPVAPQALVPQPPPLRTSQQPEISGEMEDAAAQLLRPILKQWLMENMPKIVEKALRSEAGDEPAPQAPSRDGQKSKD